MRKSINFGVVTVIIIIIGIIVIIVIVIIVIIRIVVFLVEPPPPLVPIASRCQTWRGQAAKRVIKQSMTLVQNFLQA